MSGHPNPTQFKRIHYLRETVDRETGEVTNTDREGVIEKEPNYIKLYLSGILMYADCPSWQNRVLHSLLKRINYENEISLPVGYKKQIVKELDISMSSLNNAISAFVKNNLLIRKDVGVYLANPHLFGRGEWKDIRKLRLTIKFSPEGVEMEGNVTKDEPSVQSNSDVILSSVGPINPIKLKAFLENPENHATVEAMSYIGGFIGIAFASLNQLFI